MMNSGNLALAALVLMSASMGLTWANGPLEELISGGEGGGGGGGIGGLVAGVAKGKIADVITGGAVGGGGGSGEHSSVTPTKSADKLSSVTGAVSALTGYKSEAGFLGIKGPHDLLKLLLNPIEFCKRVAKHYKLNFGKFFELINKGFSFGLEIALQPALLTLKIIEKIFVPDTCKLKFICKITTPLSFAKDHLPKLSSKFLEGSHIIKALSDGMHGIDCEATYSHCGHGGVPKLKKEYEATGEKNHEHKHQENGDDKQHEHNGGTDKQHHNQEHHGGEHQGGEHKDGGENYEANSSTNLLKTLKTVG